MDVLQLCERIGIQPEVKLRIEKILSETDLETDLAFLEDIRQDFFEYEKMKSVHTRLEQKLSDDKDHMKMLVCMLKVAADSYEIYSRKGIEPSVYTATMKCFSRFLKETYERTGRYEFDRYWWTARQAGCHGFRIGALEYERKFFDDSHGIAVHIPSDADFSPESVEKSLKEAKVFWGKCEPEMEGCEYRCHSWLLDPHLKNMLPEDSNIRKFQERFEIYDSGEPGRDFLEWLFQCQDVPETEYRNLSEKTSLQRKVKQHILAGGKIYNACGRLK